MTDYFALLDEPRRPWIDPAALKQKFLALSAQLHPDRSRSSSDAERTAVESRFAELNAAFQCLNEPSSRIKHLLELESGRKPASLEAVTPELTEFFFEVGKLTREVDAFLTEKAKASSPLLKAGLFERSQEWTEQLLTIQREVNGRREALNEELKTMNTIWTRAEKLPLERLEELWRLSGYLVRWAGQIQERIVELSL